MKKQPPFDRPEVTISANDQTGLIPSLPEDDGEAESYEELYPLHRQKTPCKSRVYACQKDFDKQADGEANSPATTTPPSFR